jgi:hypothetical protein
VKWVGFIFLFSSLRHPNVPQLGENLTDEIII